MQNILGLAIATAFIIAIVKIVSSGKTRIEPVLIMAGVFMMILAEALNIGSIFPAGKGSTGLKALDAFEYMSVYLNKSFIGVSGVIMVVFGYVMYCDAIEANQCLVKLLTDPLKKVKSPYMLLPFCVVIAMGLSLFIGTATGLSAMVMATIAPMLMGVGISRKAAASVGCMAYAIPLGLGAPVFLAGTTALGL